MGEPAIARSAGIRAAYIRDVIVGLVVGRFEALLGDEELINLVTLFLTTGEWKVL